MNDTIVNPPEIILLVRAEAKSKTTPMYELRGACELEENTFADEGYPSNIPHYPIVIYPTDVLQAYLNKLSGSEEYIDMRSAKVSIVEAPRHGTLEPYEPNSSYPPLGLGFHYFPQPRNWLGADQLTALVEFNGLSVRVKMDIVVVKGIDDRNGFGDGFSGGGETLDAIANECKLRGYENINRIRISSDSSITEPTLCQGTFYTQLASFIHMFDLPYSSLAQITGTGASAQITLDTNAAGYGWFIDYTPYLNEEWLPTSNPYEWQPV
jgi:hypothetical protein